MMLQRDGLCLVRYPAIWMHMSGLVSWLVAQLMVGLKALNQGCPRMMRSHPKLAMYVTVLMGKTLDSAVMTTRAEK
jgi:hypothetical protein